MTYKDWVVEMMGHGCTTCIVVRPLTGTPYYIGLDSLARLDYGTWDAAHNVGTIRALPIRYVPPTGAVIQYDSF